MSAAKTKTRTTGRKGSDPTPPPGTRKRELLRESSIESPVKVVWEMAEKMSKSNPGVARKEVLAECLKKGVAFHTAATQYQRWRQAQRKGQATSR